MSPEALERAALALPASQLSIQWGDARVYKVGGKMFAWSDAGGARLSFKATDLAYAVLVETGRARPSPYLARARWVRFDDVASLDEAEVADWLRTAHGLVAARLTRAVRKTLGLVEDLPARARSLTA
jgi:predicted DNA-binding protein (MmcQ/YjbR family)